MLKHPRNLRQICSIVSEESYTQTSLNYIHVNNKKKWAKQFLFLQSPAWCLTHTNHLNVQEIGFRKNPLKLHYRLNQASATTSTKMVAKRFLSLQSYSQESESLKQLSFFFKVTEGFNKSLQKHFMEFLCLNMAYWKIPFLVSIHMWYPIIS